MDYSGELLERALEAHEQHSGMRSVQNLEAVINEGLGYSLRIPLNKEHNIVLEKLGVPAGWMTSCFIGIGYPKEDERILEQYDTKPDKHIHLGAW